MTNHRESLREYATTLNSCRTRNANIESALLAIIEADDAIEAGYSIIKVQRLRDAVEMARSLMRSTT